MSDARLAFVHRVLTDRLPVARACRECGISRKTAYKWLRRFRQDEGLHDRSRRPTASPRRTPGDVEQQIVAARDEYGWGARKLRALLAGRGLELPSARAVHQVLRRHGRLRPEAAAPRPVQRFERAAPNELWQVDFKGALEVGRRLTHPLTVLDDHSRYLLALRPCSDCTMQSAWDVLWEAFAEAGLPEAILCDHAFSARRRGSEVGVSWFESLLIRLGVRPAHGRPQHPQTQGKVERLHATLVREVWPWVRRDEPAHFAADLEHWRQEVYNAVRPHEALGDEPPCRRWRPSPRPRPAAVPEVEYPAGAVVRKVM